MGKAFKCDLCKKLYEKNEIRNIPYSLIIGRHGNALDLCDECIIKLKVFIENPDIHLCEYVKSKFDPPEKAYFEPVELPTVEELNK